jgi:hypothetical protein
MFDERRVVFLMNNLGICQVAFDIGSSYTVSAPAAQET